MDRKCWLLNSPQPQFIMARSYKTLVVKAVWVQVKVNKIENTLFYASQLINQNNKQTKSFDMLLKKSEPYDKIFDKSFMTTEVKWLKYTKNYHTV